MTQETKRKHTFALWPHFEEDEIAAVQRVLASGKVSYWTGEQGKQFETEFADYVGIDHAVAVSNGTVALEFALRALGIGPGDEVVVAPRTFVATAGAVLSCGATPVFADVDRVSGNITAETIAPAITPKTKAIIPVHVAGWPCDMDPIMGLARQHGIKVIEDCAQAHGAVYRGRKVGSIGDIGAFSFCQDKIITTGGEGGMLTTNNAETWTRLWSLKDHGKSYDTVFNKQHPPGFRWLHESPGTNGRMTEMQSAIGRVALRKLSRWLEIRRGHAAIFNERFSRLPALEVLLPLEGFEHAYYKYYVNVVPGRLKPGWDRDRIMRGVMDTGCPCYSGSCCEIYLEKVFARLGLQPRERLPNARYLTDQALMFLVHPTLRTEDIRFVADAVEKVVTEAGA